jgi:hypothetical protein
MTWAPDYVSTDEAKAYLRVNDDVDDDELALIVSAASRAIDRRCGRQFGQVDDPEERFYTPEYDRKSGKWYASIDDLATTADVVVSASGVAITDYTLEPRNAVAKGLVWTLIVFDSYPGDEISMVAPWGWPAIPSSIAAGSRIQVNRFLSRRDSPYGVAGSPDDGSQLRLLAKLDPDVETMVTAPGLVRIWAVK